MSNPVSPSGSPVPPQVSGKSDEQEELTSHKPGSPFPQPGLRESSPPGATALDTSVLSRSASPLATDEDRKRLLDTINKTPKTPQSSPIFTLAKVLVLHDLEEFEQAHFCLDELLDKLPQDHPIYALACFWRGYLIVAEEGWIPPSANKSFELAQQHHFTGAIPFLMAANTGVYAGYSQVKWQNSQKVMRLLDTYTAEVKIYQSRLSSFTNQVQKHDKSDVMDECCELIKLSTDCILEGQDTQQTVLGLMTQLCHLQTLTSEKEVGKAITHLNQWMADAKVHQKDQWPIYVIYKNFLFASNAKDKEPFYKFFSTPRDNPFAWFCAAQIRAKQLETAKKSQQEEYKADVITQYLRAAVEMPLAYDALGEFLMKIDDMAEAMKAYEQGINRLNDFLDGKARLFTFRIGENAEMCREIDPDWIDEVNLDERSACEEMLLMFEAKHSLCEMSDPLEASQKKSKKKKKKKKKNTDTDKIVTDQPPGDTRSEPDKTTSPEPPTPPEITKSKPKAVATVSTEPSTGATPVELPESRDFAILNSANRCIRLDADYEQAALLLQRCSASKNNPLWYKRKQHTAWLYLQQSQDDVYLQKHHKGEELIKQRNELQKKARKEVREGLNKLIKICRPDFQTDVLSVPKDELMAIADDLEKRHPQFRVELGSLYSTMGHILKAERDRLNPRTQKQQCIELVRQAHQLFQLAHRILGKRLS